jgi:hypothetical protein
VSALASSTTQLRLAPLGADDIAWLWECRSRVTAEELRDELLFVFDKLYQSASDERRGAIRARSDLPQELRARFEASEATRTEFAQRTREHDERRRRKADETRRQNIELLATRRQDLESGADLGLLQQAWSQLKNPGATRARVDLGQLRELVGDELTASFAMGFKACWRTNEVPFSTPSSNETPIALLAGLTGLTLDIRDGLDLRTLDDREAELATRYALLEWSALPYWFDELRSSHPRVVASVLGEVLEREWSLPREHHGVMRLAPYAARDVGLLMRSIVLRLVEEHPPGHPTMVRSAADVVLLSCEDAPRLASAARVRVEQANASAQPEWLRMWVHADPIAAADWLERRRMGAEREFVTSAMELARCLEQDFDPHGRIARSTLMEPRSLERWVRLIHLAAGLQDDREQVTSQSPGSRDPATEFRRRCINCLAENPSVEAFLALRRLREDPAFISYRDLRPARQRERRTRRKGAGSGCNALA